MSRSLKIILVSGCAAALLLAGAYSALERAERARSENLTWREINGLALSQGPREAEAVLRKKLEAHPNDALLHYYLARLYYETGRGPEALVEADRAISLGYAQEISHLLKALVHGRLMGDRARQRELAAKALSYDPTFSDGYLIRAEAEHALGDYRACAADAAAFSSLEPKESDGYEYSLLCLERAGDRAGAEAAGLKALALKPASHALLWRLGRLYAARGLHARAVKNFSEAIRLSGGLPGYYLSRAASCEELRDFSCAAWDRASAAEWPEISGYASHYLLLGAAMHRVGELDLALEAADKALGLAPGGAAALELRGRLRAETGDLAGARRDLREAGASDPARAGLEEKVLPPAGRSAGAKK